MKQPLHLLSLREARLTFDRVILNDVTLNIHEHHRIGLVGKNGSGKSSLLQVMLGEQRLSKGVREVFGTIWYMPQIYLTQLHETQTVAEYLAQHCDDWWEVVLVLEKRYRWSIEEGQTLESLSGGELVKLHAALAEVIHPDVLLMDEPTNHLDLLARKELVNFVQQYDRSVIIASHDVAFLDECVNTIWEIKDGLVRVFGGDYAFYQRELQRELESKARMYEVALKEAHRLDKSEALEDKRQQNNQIAAEKYRHDRGISRMDRGYFKSKSQIRAGQKQVMLSSRREKNQSELEQYRPEKQVYINYATRQGKDFSGAHIFEVRNGELQRNRNILLSNVNLRWEYGERIVILGANGVGKSTLVQALYADKEDISLQGEVSRSQIARVEYVNQHYAMVNPEKNLIENMQIYNPEASINTIRNRLRDFLFFDDTIVYAPAENLSGGEISKLAFAMITLEPLEGLILDEPTNNLDIEATDSLLSALSSFPGGLIVVSHNVDFLRRLDPTHTYVIKNQTLEQLHLNYYSDDIWQVLTNSIQ